jgi:N6-L-threonylcarbamoyladenine synthase
MYCLGIETSCDETAVAILKKESSGNVKIIAEEISSQIDIHKAYGGIVPELAAREHLKNLPLITDFVLKKSKLELKDINLLAVTSGPGLKGCLLIGTNFARGLSLKYPTPLMGINHIEAHIFSVFLENPGIQLPFLALVVSGGHTEIVLVKKVGSYEIMTRTLDDAAGEAFDKTANLLGIPYPGGAKLAELADSISSSRFNLPKVMREAEGFSFSGLKTAIMLLVKANKENINKDKAILSEIAYAAQDAIVEALYFKLLQAINQSGVKKVAVSGGVSANKALRKKISGDKKIEAYYPSMLHCTDNAAMVAYMGLRRYDTTLPFSENLSVKARWPVEEI